MLIRLSYIFLLCALAIGALLYVSFRRGGNGGPPGYTSSQRCRVCHEAASSGAQFVIWSRGPHAHAYTALGSDTAQSYLRTTGAAVTGCLRCHTTLGRNAYNRDEVRLNAEGVGCERCHGAGARYTTYNVMKDREAFVDRGGIVGTLRDCYTCHVADPARDAHHCPFQTEPFHADSAWALIRHDIPKIQGRPDTVLQLREP